MKGNYTVMTRRGSFYKWSFTEHKNEDDYGNGIYIGVVAPSGDRSSLDCRYIKGYDFLKTCIDYLLGYYGENLAEIDVQG